MRHLHLTQYTSEISPFASYAIFFFGLFPIWCRRIKFLLTCASSLCIPVYFMSFRVSSLHLNFGLPSFRYPTTSIFHVPIITSSSHMATLLHLSSHMVLPSRFRFSYFLTYVCHTCPSSYFFIPGLLNPLYSHHPFHYSHISSFLLSLYLRSGLTSIHSNNVISYN